MAILLTIHSGVRWIIVIVGILAPMVMAQGWVSKRQFSPFDRGLSSSFSVLMALQFLLGLILLLWLGFAGDGFTLARFVHALILSAAVYVSVLPARWKQAADTIRFRNTGLCQIAALILIYVGVATVGGW